MWTIEEDDLYAYACFLGTINLRELRIKCESAYHTKVEGGRWIGMVDRAQHVHGRPAAEV